jgi:hypothetical protein
MDRNPSIIISRGGGRGSKGLNAPPQTQKIFLAVVGKLSDSLVADVCFNEYSQAHESFAV